jgi:hypothetical protein
LKAPVGAPPLARVEISPDGMRWVAEGTEAPMPARKDELAVFRVKHFGNWLRIAADYPPGAECTVIVTVHLKA